MQSQTPTKSDRIFLDQRVSDATQHFLAHGGTEREAALLMEANQRLIEYLDQLDVQQITLKPYEPIVAIIDGQRREFDTPEELAEWLTN